MLHEIFLSLSGHPSPLLTADHSSPDSILSPPEKALLSTVAHLSDIHCKLLSRTKAITETHPSSICQAVATAINSTHLARFQRKVLDTEAGILRQDAGLVGAYNIVPLTSLVGEFSDWTRRMEWFLEIVDFMNKDCTGAMVIDKLCDAVQTGFSDIEEAALSLVKVAETAWLKQVSAWILYGRLPSFGREDFFVQQNFGDEEEYQSKPNLLPAFVSTNTTASLLFIGRSLNHIRSKGIANTDAPELEQISSHLKQISSLTFPINTASFNRVIASIRLSLSQTTLQKLLPQSRVVEILTLLREFFLLGRGEFAISLITEADEKIRSRWRRADNLAYEKRDGLGNIVVKEGEVSAILARTWAAMSSLQGRDQGDEDQDDDDLLDLARDLVQLVITKPRPPTPVNTNAKALSTTVSMIASTPFSNLLLSVPVTLVLNIPSPLDLFLTPSDIQIYSKINAYLLSIHRAHIRLTNLWKITSLRRDHPAPPGPPYGSSTSGRRKVHTLRERAKERSRAMRSVWATSSAAVFFLAETEAYLQGEVVKGTWDGFKNWITGDTGTTSSRPTSSAKRADRDEDRAAWGASGHESMQNSMFSVAAETRHTHDPQTLADAHRRYLYTLATSILLTTPSFTDALYHLLQQIDHLVALVHRMQSIWQSLDLEADEGVVDAFSDFHQEEKDVGQQLQVIAGRVKGAVEVLVGCLREVDQEKEGLGKELGEMDLETDAIGEGGRYVPVRVGRVDRLLMKLDFGTWFGTGKAGGSDGLDDDLGYESE
ncbi:Spc98 family-domain-containing protein [Xylogone sp. PMI_703]|nr:Spc98 family-domain-containing protein [Xylogone sp. PMI_703]